MNMFLVVMLISLVTLLIGALPFSLLNRNSAKEKSKERNIKLLIYILTVFTIYACITFLPVAMYIIASLLIIIALREILNASAIAHQKPYIALLIGIPVLYFFAQFIKDIPSPLQLFTYFIIVHFEGFSQVAGDRFGSHKMIQSVSAVKTWEGFIGGCIVAFGISLIIYQFTSLGQSKKEIIFLTCIIILSSTAADILNSIYKHKCSIKEYSNLIPGHGGVLDRFTGFFMAGAAIELLQIFYTH